MAGLTVDRVTAYGVSLARNRTVKFWPLSSTQRRATGEFIFGCLFPRIVASSWNC